MIPLEANGEPHSIDRWMEVARAYDSCLYEHSVLVSELTAVFSAFLGFSIADQSTLVEAALLHDIGKIKIPRQLLRKPAILTPEEMAMMRTHSEIGHLLLASEGGHTAETLMIVRQHHERLDGSGYPDGLVASQIAEPVRIITLCDIYAAMTEPRPYGTVLQGPEALLTMATKRTRIDLPLMKHFSVMATALLFPRIAWSESRLYRSDSSLKGAANDYRKSQYRR